MDKQLLKIKEALSRIPGDEELGSNAEISSALDEIDQSLDLLKSHPHSDKIQATLAKTATCLDEENHREGDLVSLILNQLTEELNEYEEAHPGATLLVSRLANALAVYGL